MKPIASFEQFRDSVAAYRLPRVIVTALEIDLFTALGSQRWTVENLARELKVSERGLRMLCRNLAMAGLLIKRGEQYWNSRLAATALNAAHSGYRGHYLELIAGHWKDWNRLTEAVRSGRPLDQEKPDEPEYRRKFTWAMHHRTMEIAPGIASQISLGGVKTLLDLGGGPGTYAMAFLSKNRGLQATVCDRPAALEVAKEIAEGHPAGKRLAYLPLDLLSEDIPGRYDVVWYSNVLHIYSSEQNQSLFRRVSASLNPGGRFLIQDAFLHDREGLQPDDASLFALSMLLFTESGDTYKAADTSRWLRDAGFTSAKILKLKKGTEDWEDGILEARLPARSAQKPAPRTRSTTGLTGRLRR